MFRVALFYLLLMLPYVMAVHEDNIVLAGNGDIWNTLWTWHHIAENWTAPFYSDQLLAPKGSSIVPSDMVGGYLYAIFSKMISYSSWRESISFTEFHIGFVQVVKLSRTLIASLFSTDMYLSESISSW